jgi:hypothetical protein
MASFRVVVDKTIGGPQYSMDRNNNSKHWKRAAHSSKNSGAHSTLCQNFGTYNELERNCVAV